MWRPKLGCPEKARVPSGVAADSVTVMLCLTATNNDYAMNRGTSSSGVRIALALAGALTMPFAMSPTRAASVATPAPGEEAALDDAKAGFVSIFNGKNLAEWDGTSGVWSVVDGAIVGHSSVAHPSGRTFLIWRGGQPADFELKLEIRFDGAAGAHSGIEYRSRVAAYTQDPSRPAPASLFNPAYESWNLGGYRCSFDAGAVGGLYEEGASAERGYLAHPGQVVRLERGLTSQLIGELGPDLPTLSAGQWTNVHLIARGETLIHIVNGRVAMVAIDDDAMRGSESGLFGIQLEATGEGSVAVRNIRLKTIAWASTGRPKRPTTP
jgi:hypothetical protein